MEPTGLTIGVVGLTGQLAKVAMDCYKIFDDMSDVGSTYDAILHELRTQGLLLKGWEQAWGFGSGTNQQQLEPEDYRYRYVTASLARIVAVFASVDKLQAKYGVVVKKESIAVEPGNRKAKFRDRLSISIPVRFRSKSPSTSTAQIPVSGPTNDDLHLLENPQVLENKDILPGLEEEIISMTKAIDRVQQSLPLYLKLRWVFSDNAKLEELLKMLTCLNNGLFRVLPTSESSLYLPANSSQLTLKLLFDIPLCLNVRKNPDFVGRKYLLEKIKQEIGNGGGLLNIIVLYGTGGMGKTQLTLEYVYQHYRDYSSVFWVNTASVQTTILGFTQIMQQLVEHHVRKSKSKDIANVGQLLGMAGRLDSMGYFAVTSESDGQHVVDAVKRWFSATENTNWLLVFDNLDDLDSVDIEDYLPLCNHGTVIITSRRRESIQQGRRGLEVQQMHSMEAIQLLLRTCLIPNFEALEPIEQSAASTIAQELGYLPLALSQAGAFIHISEYSLSRYLKEYQTNANYLLNQRWTQKKHDRSVFATWEISFQAIQEKNPKAADLLLVCGFFDHEDIQEQLLRRGLKLETDDFILAESIRTLFSYSLVKRGSRNDSFSIHPLVHSWARLRLKSEPQKEVERAREAFQILVTGVHNTKQFERGTEDWIFEQQIMLHADAVTKHTVRFLAVDNMKTQDGAYKLGDVYMWHGRTGKAMEWYGRALEGREKALGINHPDTLATVHAIAVGFNNQGQYDKALEWYGRALAGEEKAMGVDHPEALATVHNMAFVFMNQGQYDKALEWYGRALAGEEKAMGVDHPGTLTTVHNIACLYMNQGQFDKALEWYGRALSGREQALGIDHPHTLATVYGMASVFNHQGQYDKALEWYGRALAGAEKALGCDHPCTLTTVHGMASVFNHQRQYDKALEWYQRALAGRSKSEGVDHPSTLTTVHGMASVFNHQGQYDKALEWYGRALAGREKVLGVDHPHTLASVSSMASVFDNQGRYHKALELYGRVLARREKSLGVSHPSTQSTIRCLINLHERTRQTEHAQRLQARLYREAPNSPSN